MVSPWLKDQSLVVVKHYKELGGQITVIIKEGEGPSVPLDGPCDFGPGQRWVPGSRFCERDLGCMLDCLRHGGHGWSKVQSDR